MSENRDRVVVVSWRRSFGVGARPFLAIRLRDLAVFRFVQPWPAFSQCGEALSPIMARPGLDPQIIIEIVQVNRCGFTERHFRGHSAAAVASPLSMLF